jgi:hypothetical protein
VSKDPAEKLDELARSRFPRGGSLEARNFGF